MEKLKIKRKLLFLGEINSINTELITKSFNYLKNKVHYILICNKDELAKDIFFKKKKFNINEVNDPINFSDYKEKNLNIYNVENLYKKKYLNLLNQIKVCNNLANSTKYDLITLPINKAIFKKQIKFTGMTEYLGALNKKSTAMLMYGNKFSIIPLTTHINVKNIHKSLKLNYINSFIKKILIGLKSDNKVQSFKHIIFLCYNPHCSEDGNLGEEDLIIKKVIKNFRQIKGPYPADSAFLNIKKNSLFLSTYHDQALIPFKIINKKSVNLTLGLSFRRLSPAHGTARDIKNKNIADTTSYKACLLF